MEKCVPEVCHPHNMTTQPLEQDPEPERCGNKTYEDMKKTFIQYDQIF